MKSNSDESWRSRIVANIEHYGCHVIHVLEDDTGPGFTYSIGIEERSSHPEMIATGLKREVGLWIVNEYNRRIMAGEIFLPDQLYSGFLEGFDVLFKPVEKVHYPDYFGRGQAFYGGNDFRVLQLIFPSTSGIWPWDKNASEGHLWFMLRLYV